MDKKIAEMWVAALRSRKYKKTTSALKVVKEKKSKFCVLGVLCDLYQKNHEKQLKEEKQTTLDARRNGWKVVYIDGRDGRSLMYLTGLPIPDSSGIPPKVMEWAGIKHGLGLIQGEITLRPSYQIYFPSRTNACLKFMNDEYAMSFKLIADFIEENYESL